MKCEQIRESFIESRLPAETQAHVGSCAACAQAWAEHQKVFALLDEWKVPEPSPFFDTRLNARVREIKAAEADRTGAFGWLHKPMFGMPVWRTAAAATLAIAGGMGIGVMRKNQDGQKVMVAETAVSDVQQLDKHQDEISSLDLLDDLNAADSGIDNEDEL